MYEEKINAYFDAPERRAELVEAISRLVRIRSVREEPLPGMPFGPGPAAALAEGLKLAEELGFATRNYDNYVGTADLNDKETALHILCHLDVVGEGTGWTVTEPYVPKEVDGMLYGRGTDDDKGPVAAVLLAMKAVKELGENAPWEEIAERIKTRTMYMGPEAYGLYTQNYSVMQGMTPSDGSLTKEDAPIKIDIAYTLVK